jgi:hypothetical protein
MDIRWCHSCAPLAPVAVMLYRVLRPNAIGRGMCAVRASAAAEISGVPTATSEAFAASAIHAGNPPIVPSGNSKKM